MDTANAYKHLSMWHINCLAFHIVKHTSTTNRTCNALVGLTLHATQTWRYSYNDVLYNAHTFKQIILQLFSDVAHECFFYRLIRCVPWPIEIFHIVLIKNWSSLRPIRNNKPATIKTRTMRNITTANTWLRDTIRYAKTHCNYFILLNIYI